MPLTDEEYDEYYTLQTELSEHEEGCDECRDSDWYCPFGANIRARIDQY